MSVRASAIPKPGVKTSSLTPVTSGVLQRKCACGGSPGMSGECDECSGERLQRKPARSEVPDRIPPIVNDALRSAGEPLASGTRHLMESRFGHDFSRVRIHRDALAGESARAVSALAYTVGQDVVFAGGQYTPETMGGRKLLAHELAHVVQQRNASYPVGGLTMADASFEHEADSAAEAVMTGRSVPGALRAATAPQLARQQAPETKSTVGKDGQKVDVTRVVTPGKCIERPKTRTSSNTEITRSKASINLNYCRGKTNVGATGEIDYSDVVRRAVRAVPNFFTSGDPQQALNDLEQSLKQAEPTAKVVIDVQVGGVKGKITATGKGSIGGGASGDVEATVGGVVGSTGVDVGAKVGGGTQQPTTAIGTVTITPGAGKPESPHCYECVCGDPTFTFSCVVHPEKPDTPKTPTLEPLYVPLFYKYQEAVPRAGWEENYVKEIGVIIDRLRAGYTIERIEGGTSPEGTLKKKPGFEGNIKLAQERADRAQTDLRAALDKAIGRETLKARDFDSEGLRRLKDARSAGYKVTGLAVEDDPSSAELFGTADKKEVPDKELLKTLKKTLAEPKEGQEDPLATQHVIGKGLPADVRAEVEAEVKVFREGKRDGKQLKDKDLLETIYRPLRRALITLKPPAAPAVKIDPMPRLKQKELENIVGESIACLPEHKEAFNNTFQDSWYEGECKPKSGGVGEKVK